MCNRAVSLIARVVESYGMSTVALSLNREISEKILAPRTLYLRFPYGAPLGEPGNVNQQRTIFKEMCEALAFLKEPGIIVEMPYRWRRDTYGPVDFAALNNTE
jgi:D-proline reductase (dithiol) PrdB